MGLICMVMYVWSRKNPDTIMNFFFGFKFKGIYLPWVMLGFSVLIGNSPVDNLIGIFVGHLYYFLVVIAPRQYNRHLLSTPQFLHDIFAADGFFYFFFFFQGL